MGPHHGINLPLSALRSAKSSGIGEFFDLLPLIDWCEQLKLDCIQLLPLNDSEVDPSPYNAISSCALHPIYLSLHALPFLQEHVQLQAELEKFASLNQTHQVAYLDVLTHKMHWLRSYFDKVGQTILSDAQCGRFLAENPWVEGYALFKTLFDKFGGVSWKNWPSTLCPPSIQEREELKKRYSPDIAFHLVVQYLCYAQLKRVKSYANQRGIFLMGDIPILVSALSSDVWEHPPFFNTDLQAGAPPDVYNKEGQNWGFPLYRWDVMAEEKFSWWKQRLRYAENFFDLFRIDHVLGFFRIWSISPGHASKDGAFLPANEAKWEPQGKMLLAMIAEATTMLPIAEDLGAVPKMVRPCLQAMGICGTKVMRWERVWEEDGHFIPIEQYSPLSLTCLSTHDSETLTLWWKDFQDEAKGFALYKQWTYAPELTPQQREEILWDSHHTASLFHINLFQEYLALFPELIHAHPEEERINIPGKVLPSNWTYRFRLSIEEIVAHQGLFGKMQIILGGSGNLARAHASA